MLGTGLVSCAAAWLVVRPTRIRWVRWPSWSFALAGAGYLVRAWLLATGRPWPEVLALAIFYLVSVALQEEFIYRGCVEEGLSELGPWASAIVAGLFFGLCHAPLAILRG
ncbi:MAG TPA: CPBP family glutamic-type intramembrane protease, partial [Symbiobacteriaceae bacterium]|nr:CPBP family glutamic-type intramembrane protease [Symbiobacteriaceae bacterium]